MFTVQVADNFHYMDMDEVYTFGEFKTWEEALTAAKRIVERSLEESFKENMTAEELYTLYTTFGEDPFIIPSPEGEHFSAWEYAKLRCAVLCMTIHWDGSKR